MVITIICGGYSFFLGVMVSGLRFIPMIAAMMVTAAVLAWIESRGQMGDIKTRFPLLKRAMRYGTRFRIFWAFLYPVGLVLANAIFGTKGWLSFFSMLPAMSDVWIGIAVTELFKIIGFNIEKLEGGARTGAKVMYPEWIAQLGVFGISLTTAAIHVMILGLMTLLIWAGLSVFYRATGRHPREGGDPA